MQNYNLKFKSDLISRCYKLSLDILSLTDILPNKRSCWIIGDQLIRSATSVGANLIEARASSSRLEFKKFHEIALKSANESKYWLSLLRDAKWSDQIRIDALLDEINQISNMIAAGVLKLKNKNF